MIVIETCPKCGHDLRDLILASNPPIPQKKCFGCGWSWTGEREEVIRVPFGGNSSNILNGGVTNEESYTLRNVNCIVNDSNWMFST